MFELQRLESLKVFAKRFVKETGNFVQVSISSNYTSSKLDRDSIIGNGHSKNTIEVRV